MKFFRSGIILENRCVISQEENDKYKDILNSVGIEDTEENAMSMFVKVQLLPPNDEWWTDPDTWVIRIGQNFLPDWFKRYRELYLAEFRAEVKEWWKQHVLVNQKIDELTNGYYWLKRCKVGKLGKNVKVLCNDSSIGLMYGNSIVSEMYGNSTIGAMYHTSSVGAMYNNSIIGVMFHSSAVGKMWDSSIIREMRGTSNVKEINGNSTVYMMKGNSIIHEMRDNSTIYEMVGNSTVGIMCLKSTIWRMRGASTVRTMCDQSIIEKMYDNAIVGEMLEFSIICEMWNNNAVREMRDNSIIRKMYGKSTVDKMSGNSTIGVMKNNSIVKKMYDNSIVRAMFDSSAIRAMYDNSIACNHHEEVIHISKNTKYIVKTHESFDTIKEKNQTNTDRIKCVTIEELTKLLHNNGNLADTGNPKFEIWIKEEPIIIDDSFDNILEWLRVISKKG